MKKGFTLLELLIVIIIIGTLAAIALPRYFANLEKARETEAKATTNRIREAELANFSNTGAYVLTAAFPISVNISGGAQPDIYLAMPVSSNFTYTVVGATNPTTGAVATHVVGTVDYYRCFESGKFGSGAITCP